MGDAVEDPELEAAVRLHQAGKVDRAAGAYRKILETRPDHPNALHLLGVTELQEGRLESAVELIGRAIAVRPGAGVYHVNLAAALRALRRTDDAIAEAEKAIALDPRMAAQGYHIAALAFMEAAQWEDAVHCWVHSLKADPDFAEAHLSLSTLLDRHANLEHAALQLQYATDLGRKAVEREPDSAQAHLQLARSLEQGGRLADAVAEYRIATRLLPHDATVFHALGRALHRQGHDEEALTCVRFAVRMNPRVADAHVTLASLLLAHGRPPESADAARAAITLVPRHPDAHARLAAARAAQGDIPQAIDALRAAADHDPGSPAIGSALLRTLTLDDRATPQQIFDEHLRWYERHASRFKPLHRPFHNHRAPDRTLRIGFVSASFRRSAIAKFIMPLLGQLDRTQFTAFCYNSAAAEDDVSRKIANLCDGWRHVAANTDSQLAIAVRDDQVDVLVDLDGHGRGNRLIMFAQRPAPVQLALLGHGATSGLPWFDARLTDALLDPPGETDAWHTEPLARPNAVAWCYRPWEPVPGRIETRGVAGEPITFASINDTSRLCDRTLAAWASLMSRVSDARLLVACGWADREALRQRLARHGIDIARAAVMPPAEGQAYLGSFNTFDVALDAFPSHPADGFAAGDAMLMGKPTVTLAGRPAGGRRASAAILMHAGLGDCVAAGAEQYVDIAAALAADRQRLAHLRDTLREQFTASPVCDAKAYAAGFADFCRAAWRRFCESPS